MVQEPQFDDDADLDDDLGIVSSSNAPEGWSHPLCVDSLEPTLATPEHELPENIPRKSVSARNRHRSDGIGHAVKQRQVPSRGQHRENAWLMKKVKRPVTMLPLKNGEMFAILEENDDELRTACGMPPKKSKRRGRPPKAKPAPEETSAASDALKATTWATEKPADKWASCDRCQKWRRVNDDLFHDIKSNEWNRWFCEMNSDPAYARCSAPEEVEEGDTAAPALGCVEPVCDSTWIVHLEAAYKICNDAEKEGVVSPSEDVLPAFRPDIDREIAFLYASKQSVQAAHAQQIAIGANVRWISLVIELLCIDNLLLLSSRLRSFIWGACRSLPLQRPQSESTMSTEEPTAIPVCLAQQKTHSLALFHQPICRPPPGERVAHVVAEMTGGVSLSGGKTDASATALLKHTSYQPALEMEACGRTFDKRSRTGDEKEIFFGKKQRTSHCLIERRLNKEARSGIGAVGND